MGEIVRLLARTAAQRQGLPVGRGGQPGTALVEEQHAKFLHGASQPCLRADEAPGAEARAALQIDQPRQIVAYPAARHGLSAEDLDLLTARIGVVERDREIAVGEDDAGVPVAAHKLLLNQMCHGQFSTRP